MSVRMKSETTTKHTILPAYLGGVSLFDWLGGRKEEGAGQALVHAKASRQPASARPKKTPATSGPSSTASSLLAARSSSSASRSPASTDADGSVESRSTQFQERLAARLRETINLNSSPEFELIWKEQAMLSGPPICQLACRRRTSGRDSSSLHSWPSPTASLADKGVRSEEVAIVEAARNHGPDLAAAASMTGWTTPQAHDTHPRGQGNRKNPAAGNACLASDAMEFAPLTNWATPTAEDQRRGSLPPRPTDTGVPLSQMVVGCDLSGWATPDAQLFNDGADPEKHQERLARLKEKHGNGNGAGLPLGQMAHLGATTESSTAVMGRVGGLQLNPSFSAWLLGFPKIWCLSSPHWEDWELIQWQLNPLSCDHARTESADCAGTGIP